MQKHVAPATAAGALALHLIGDEEADKRQTLNNLLGNRSRNQGLNRCVAWTATAKWVDRMKRRDTLLRVPGHAETSPSAAAGARVLLMAVACFKAVVKAVKNQTSNLKRPISCSFQSSP